MDDDPFSSMFFPEVSEPDSSAETEATELEDINPLPTPQRQSTPGDTIQRPVVSLASILGTSNSEHDTSFRPKGDIPRVRPATSRFRKISNIKAEDVTEGIKTEETVSIAESVPQFRGRKRTSSFDDSRIEEKPSARRRVPHDFSLGPSMTTGAVDYRQRKAVNKEYQAHFASLLDSDIVEQVDAEGGITPQGRLFKAGVRMLERVREERNYRRLLASREASVGEVELAARAEKAEVTIKECKANLEALLKRLG